MANNILLTKFTVNDKGMLTEKDSHNMGACLIPEKVENICIRNNLFSKAMICEEDVDSEYPVFYISNNSLERVLTIIVDYIEENCKSIAGTELSKKERYELHNSNCTLYNLRSLIQMKKERFIENKEILLIYEGEINKGECENA